MEQIVDLSVGQPAPNFEAKDQKGELIRLKDFEGKKIILYFYPKDDTPGCTKQACNLRDNYETLLNKGYVVLGVSADDEASHKKFADKYNLPFPLLADPEKQIILAYGVWKEKNMYGKKSWGIARTTFVIDEQLNIAEIIKKVDTEGHTEQILK